MGVKRWGVGGTGLGLGEFLGAWSCSAESVSALTFPSRVRSLIWVSGFGFRVSGFGFRVSGFGFWGLGFGFRVSGFGFGFRVSGFGFRVWGFGFRVQV